MTADDYLSLANSYADSLEGLRWSKCCDAIEFADGRTLALVQQVGMVLEGVFTAYPAVPHFAHVVHLLNLSTRIDSRCSHEMPNQLFKAYQACTGPGVSRNLGVLFTHLCRKFPHIASPPSPESVQLSLKRRLLFPEESEHRVRERPAFGPSEFERRLSDVLAEFSLTELIHWMQFGCDPLEQPGRRLAEPLIEPPRRLEQLIAVLRRRARLAGAVALAPALDAALAIPPRRHIQETLPVGGYAGVVTRGDPERLLPSQFALEPFDFVRRFSENELLYFRREEPHRGQCPERLVIFDQGVRTWGGIRLALAAAVIALIGRNQRRAGPLRLAATSSAEPPIDVTRADADTLADLLESSDLSPHPAAALSLALRGPFDDRPRDVILLTHPRNAEEPAVRSALADRSRLDRVFSLTVDDAGAARLSEWRDRGTVILRSFRVDLTRSASPSGPEAAKPAALGLGRSWTGDIEPITYPFCPGLISRPSGLGFDAAGEWVIAHGADGILHAARLDSSTTEIWPRACSGGVLFKLVDAVLGLDGGIAVCGRMPARNFFRFDSVNPRHESEMRFVVAHYDLIRRHVALHPLGAAGRSSQWHAFPELNTVVLKVAGVERSVDLTTGCQYPPDGADERSDARAREAYERAKSLEQPAPHIPCCQPGEHPRPGPRVRIVNGAIALENVHPPWPPFVPTSDGRPLLEQSTVHGRCQLAGQTLAIETTSNRGRKRRLLVIHGPSGRLVSELALTPKMEVFQLSPNGELLARQRGIRAVEVMNTANARPVFSVDWSGVHSNIQLARRGYWLRLSIGAYTHAFRLDESPLKYRTQASDWDGASPDPFRPEPLMPKTAQFDPNRFRPYSIHGTVLLVDVVGGQVVLLDPDERPAVHILVRRNLAAIALPGGVCWGSPLLLGRPESPDASEKIGAALKAIWRG